MKSLYRIPGFLFTLILDLVVCSQTSRITHNLPWDPRIDNKFDFGETKHKDVFINDKMEIFCPQYDAAESDTLVFAIYNVTRKPFDECVLSEEPQKIYECNDPVTSRKLTTKFQQKSPNPLGFTFRPGCTYYYMALPLKNDTAQSALDRPCDGVMRLSITVHPRRSHDHSRYSPKPTSPPSSTTPPPTTTTSTTTTTTTTTSTKTLYSRIASSGSSDDGVKDGLTGGRACSCHTSSLALIAMSVIISFLIKR